MIEGFVDEFKKDNGRLLDWYRTRMQELSIDVKLDTEITAQDVKNLKADMVIVATGSAGVKPNVTGIDKTSGATTTEVLLKQKPVWQKVVVDSGLAGCETALSLSMDGKDVTIVEISPQLVAADYPVPHMNKNMVLDMLIEITSEPYLTRVCSKLRTVRWSSLMRILREALYWLPRDNFQ